MPLSTLKVGTSALTAPVKIPNNKTVHVWKTAGDLMVSNNKPVQTYELVPFSFQWLQLNALQSKRSSVQTRLPIRRPARAFYSTSSPAAREPLVDFCVGRPARAMSRLVPKCPQNSKYLSSSESYVRGPPGAKSLKKTPTQLSAGEKESR